MAWNEVGAIGASDDNKISSCGFPAFISVALKGSDITSGGLILCQIPLWTTVTRIKGVPDLYDGAEYYRIIVSSTVRDYEHTEKFSMSSGSTVYKYVGFSGHSSYGVAPFYTSGTYTLQKQSLISSYGFSFDFYVDGAEATSGSLYLGDSLSLMMTQNTNTNFTCTEVILRPANGQENKLLNEPINPREEHDFKISAHFKEEVFYSMTIPVSYTTFWTP